LLELTKPDAPHGTLCAELRGVADVEILRRTLNDLARHCAREEGEQIILDLRDVELRCTLIELRSLGDELARLGFQPSWRMAIVGTSTNSGFAFFEAISQSHGMQFRFFKHPDAARDWLESGR
jgi:hypothetical protein